MKKRFACYAVIISLLIGIYSCQKEIVWQSIGELQKEAGNCALTLSHGAYAFNTTLTAGNYITVSVNVTLPGEYRIYTDTVNGYFFQAKGTFAAKGKAQVTLTGSGKPAAPGVNDFTVHYGESVCYTTITVTSDTIARAAYSFTDASGNCLADSVQGAYIKGIPADTSSVVIASVRVLSPGTYSVATNSVNGYRFSATGEFTDTGIQTIRLMASGTPAKAGTDDFTFDSSSCSFQVLVLAAVAVSNNDLLPLSAGNMWLYDDVKNTGNTITQTVTGTQTENGNSYYIINEQNKTNNTQYLFRKMVLDNEIVYNEYAPIDKYTSSFNYNKIIDTTLLFLRENIGTNSAWESVEIKDTASFGQVIFFKYYYQCLKANTAVVINGKAFANVYEIRVQPEIKSEFGNYGPADPEYLYYYARGIGLIYSASITTGYVTSAMQIRSWKVN